MKSKILVSIILMIGLGCNITAGIKLQRYSTSTYTNINAKQKTIGRLGVKETNESSPLSVMRVGFRQYSNPYINTSSQLSLDNKLTLLHQEDGKMYSDILFYPNPLRLKQGAVLQYVLNKPSNIIIQIYDMFGHLIFTRHLIEGGEGARDGSNTLSFDASVFNYYDVSAGVYMLYVFDNKYQLIGRTKFAIVP